MGTISTIFRIQSVVTQTNLNRVRRRFRFKPGKLKQTLVINYLKHDPHLLLAQELHLETYTKP